METARKVLEFVRPGSEVEFTEGTEKEIGLSKLINRLNYLNFQEQSILVNFRHPRYSRTITMEATPLPCLDNRLECRWTGESRFKQSLASCGFENILIDNGHKLVVAAPELVEVGESGALFLLPEKSIEVNYRKTRRHNCEGVQAELLQHGAHFKGTLIDFSAVSFKIEIKSSPTQAFFWINEEVPVQVVFSRDSQTVYSGECRIIAHKLGHKTRSYVLEPLQSHIQRFKAKEIRSSRYQLLPLPNAVFKHPLTGKSTDLKVIDISGSGLSVQEDLEFAVLLPGMIIPELEIRIANGFSTTCMAQVVYRQVQTHEDGSSDVRCGITLLDMDIREHVNLLSLLYLAKNKYYYMNSKVNTEELWQFFFESGFIYPAKYAFVEANKALLKEMYEKLYTENPSIARQFIYQEKGAILGHLAVLRFYENTWLVHHHAANKSESNNAGVVVLTQMIQMVNDSYNLHSAHMTYMLCYFRPENKFPNRVYGGAEKLIGDKKGCSIDTFAYLHYHRPAAAATLPSPWSLAPSSAEDLIELESFYEDESGGLMLDALHLQPDTVDCEELFDEYRSLGFNMQRHCHTLKLGGEIKAVLTVNLSDLGLNLSDLTNCIHVLVLDQEQLPKEIVEQALSILAAMYQQSELPVLVYPVSYADAAGISYEKRYSLWALDTPNHLVDVCKFLDSLTSRSRTKGKHHPHEEQKSEAEEVTKAGNA
jgi:hypothetical protein